MTNEYNNIPASTLNAIDELWAALRAAPPLHERGLARDKVWTALWNAVTTRGEQWAEPMGSSARIRITSEHADAELIAAWEWLERNEVHARALPPVALFVQLRGVATRSGGGSARATNADSMHGVTEVPGGVWLNFGGSDVLERVA